MYIGPNTLHRTNNFLNRVPDLLTKVLPKAVSGLARSTLARRSGNETKLNKITNVLPNTVNIKELNELTKK